MNHNLNSLSRDGQNAQNDLVREQTALMNQQVELMREQNELLREQSMRSARQADLLEDINHSLAVLRTVVNANAENAQDRATARHRDIESSISNVRNALSNLR